MLGFLLGKVLPDRHLSNNAKDIVKLSTSLIATLAALVATIFLAWGVFAPRNPIVAVALLPCALSVSGATFLILELDRPLTGWIMISPVPIREAIAHLGE